MKEHDFKLVFMFLLLVENYLDQQPDNQSKQSVIKALIDIREYFERRILK